MTVLSVDLGGTTMRAAVVAADGTLRERATEPTPTDAPCPDALNKLIESVRAGAGETGTPIDAVVVGVPGRVNYSRGALEHAPNLPPAWPGELTERHLAALLELPVHLANDADLAAVGEAWYGAGEGYRDVVYLTISTGMGAGVVLNSRVLRGTRSFAEIGHTILSLPDLAVGRPATAEDLGSGTAMAANAQAAGLQAEGADLVALVRAGDARARAVWDATLRAAGAAAVNLAHLFSPDVLVIGGGLGRNGDLVLDPLRELLAEHGPRGLAAPIAVVEAELGDDSGLIGGAAWLRAI